MNTSINITLMTILLSGILFTSCQKKKEDPMPVVYTKDKVTQPWSIDHMTGATYNTSSGALITSDTIDGRSNGYYLHLNQYSSYVQNMDGTVKTGTWSLPNDYTIVFDGTGSYTIESLTTGTMTLRLDEYGSGTHNVGRIYLYR